MHPPPQHAKHRRSSASGRPTRALPAVLAAVSAGLAACGGSAAETSVLAQPRPAPVVAAVTGEEELEVAPPPLSPETFPCSDCHAPDLPARRERRELRFAHTEIELHHAEGTRWCIDCHSPENRDMLHLVNGELVSFEESYRLCGQCHGDKYRDWRAGIHGRRTGSWNGTKAYLLCVHCHDSHAPAFRPLEPMPPPVRPARTP